MTRVALSWPERQSVRVAPLAIGSTSVIGRSQDAGIFIDDPTISRQHAAITVPGPGVVGSSTIEHLSHTNPTRLNGAIVGTTAQLKDGDKITIGEVVLVFHDLAAADRLSGPVCNVCGRENDELGRDCWYCGTSLLNAPTTVRKRTAAVCRLIAVSGEWVDLYPERAITLGADGGLAQVTSATGSAAARVEAIDTAPVLFTGSAEPGAADAGQKLETGGLEMADGVAFGVIVRGAPGE
jgi:FHA domain